MATASVFLTIVGMVLGVVCRLNFGKGLTHCRESFSLWVGPPGTEFQSQLRQINNYARIEDPPTLKKLHSLLQRSLTPLENMKMV